MKTILVTGGSGFLGSEVCQMLVEAGHRVVDISIEPNSLADVEGHVLDITDYPAVESVVKNHRFDAIIHLAALLTTQSSQNPESAFRVNVLGAHHLLEVARNHQIPRFVYSSTFSTIGPIPMKQCPVDEGVIQAPINFYGETKRFVEKMCISYAQKFGLRVAIGRLGALVGPGKPLGTSAWRMDIFNMLITGGSITYKFTSQTRLLISHLKDTARAFLCLALAEKLQHAIYHLTHDALTMQQLGDIVQKLNPQIHFAYGTNEQVDMPHSINTERFVKEFNFQPISIKKALENFQKGSY